MTTPLTPQKVTLLVYQNPMLLATQKEEQCIFCLDNETPQQIIFNTACPCKYRYHLACQEQWDAAEQQKGKPPTCLLCHKPRPTAPPHQIVEIVIRDPVAEAIAEDAQTRRRQYRQAIKGIVIAIIVAFFLIMFRFWI
jgi:hypothetical protein